MPQLIWFRNDLRVADNPALVAACSEDDTVEACFILTPGQWQAHDWSPSRVNLVLNHVEDLGRKLATLGMPLHILQADRFSDSLDVLEKLTQERKVSAVHINEEYGVNERRRDKSAYQRLEKHNVVLHKYRDQTVAPVGTVLTQQDQPYSVFTPFSRSWWDWVEKANPQSLAIPSPQGPKIKAPARASTPSPFAEAPSQWVRTGEDAAHDALSDFLDERADRYKEDRDFPSVNGTSLLSPYLASGILSGRQCLQAGREALRDNPEATGIRTWLNEICWRDFYVNILYHYPRVSMHRAFKPETEDLTWNDPGDSLQAWKDGRTGVPLLDAAMRQLNQTGWMHNRLRMVTAMFLSKNLFLDWRLGEAYFMQNLVDGFLASNNGGWQWSASTGTDAAPYFRVFNPMTQSERFDPQGDFIRRYVPELRDLDNKRIHNPAAGGTVPKGYVHPIVDLKESRKEAIARFQALKK
ncbi:deoxyribodipyrimidine photo-lyase [Marinobacter fonticola]|uniref:deoxyribodipyrimidine photo-lyase n=1 Tax=Marinobacter fonticola TaxID=2603215 RepID=UPI0011E71E69|nr:deoxyribodipyrimidine photo-lyase [Marinobacter fonticola]